MNNVSRSFSHVLVTGGAGFIGSHLLRLLVHKYPQTHYYNFDALTYAGNLANVAELESAANYHFIKGNLLDKPLLLDTLRKHSIDAIVHLAAESHVDRSIIGPDSFVMTNTVGTANLLGAALEIWKVDLKRRLFLHISTDEVFGSLGAEGKFDEHTPYDPRSPYSASKAASDHLVRAFSHTYGLQVIITNCSNNFGSHQFPEKLIPLMIRNAVNHQPLPVYGSGQNVRDWLWVVDHARALDMVLHHGLAGSTYCIGGNNEWKNIDLVKLICRLVDEKLNRPEGTSEKLITLVADRPGHDARYAIDSSKIQRELGWKPTPGFDALLSYTIDWYLANEQWVSEVTSGEYMHYYEKQYHQRTNS